MTGVYNQALHVVIKTFSKVRKNLIIFSSRYTCRDGQMYTLRFCMHVCARLIKTRVNRENVSGVRESLTI